MDTGSPPNSPPNSPWCVKGIGRDLRAAAKQAAQREGITIGAWLSRLILEAVGHRIPPVRPAQTAALEAIVGDIRRLTSQIAAAEARADAAVAPLSEQVARLSSRLDTLHPAGAGESRQVEQSMADITLRLRELEKSIAAPHRQGVLFGPFDQARR
jgi:localization factor PodJL